MVVRGLARAKERVRLQGARILAGGKHRRVFGDAEGASRRDGAPAGGPKARDECDHRRLSVRDAKRSPAYETVKLPLGSLLPRADPLAISGETKFPIRPWNGVALVG